MTTTTDAVAHLTPAHWATANRQLVRKALAEFAHERLLTPEPLGGDRYAVRSDDTATEYRFGARRFALDHWQVDAASVTRHRHGQELPWTPWSSSSNCARRSVSRPRSCRSTWRRSPPRWPEPRTN